VATGAAARGLECCVALCVEVAGLPSARLPRFGHQLACLVAGIDHLYNRDGTIKEDTAFVEAGWVLTTAVVAALSGLLRRD
jgi:hypothetical protein